MKKFNDILKIVLTIFSCVLVYSQYKQGNNTLMFYWVIVAIYWLTNYLSGKKK